MSINLEMENSWVSVEAGKIDMPIGCAKFTFPCAWEFLLFYILNSTWYFFFLLFLYLLNGYTSDYWLVFHYGYILYFPDGFSYLLVICIPSKWSEVAQSCPTLCDPVDCSLPGSSVPGILQARILEWAAISFYRGSAQPRVRTQVSHTADRCFTLWATREGPKRFLMQKDICKSNKWAGKKSGYYLKAGNCPCLSTAKPQHCFHLCCWYLKMLGSTVP